ncbi:MAG TPA: molybdenum cofactor guanylyltransferase [Blastocatellia bacterium]|nr:molybdenum cofactor guanylyltransferase [Blastocatellia bacterium]
MDDIRPQISDPGGSNPQCFIQAGGRSARMGEDKSWLPLDGRPMIEHVLAAACEIAPHPAIVISSKNPQAARYHELAERWHAEVLDDLYNHCGPLGGIYTALAGCSAGESALILACDLPFVTAEFLRRLRQIHETEKPDLTIPLDRASRAQMLVGIYSAACREPLGRMLGWNELAADRLRLRVRARLVPFREYAHLPDAARFLTNVNTPEEYQAVEPAPTEATRHDDVIE